jgi:hypothetical protein
MPSTNRQSTVLRLCLRLHARVAYTFLIMRRHATSESSREAHIGVRTRDLSLFGCLLLLPPRGGCVDTCGLHGHLLGHTRFRRSI